MFLKAAFKDASVFVQLVMLLAMIAFGVFFAMFLVSLMIFSKIGVSPEAVKDLQQNLFDYPDILRGGQFLQTLGIFLLPSIICAWLFSDNYKEYLRIDSPIRTPVAVWAVISMLVAVPFLNLTSLLNQQITLPEALKGLEAWIKESEEAATRMTDVILDTKDASTIIFNILIVCVVAGIAEEFMFRGLLQTLFGKVFKNRHVLIWLIAILFSAIHFQFYGFIPRMLLGAWLGYLMYYTQTIWIPVLAHFTNNFLSVGLYYIFQNTPDEVQKIDALGSGSTLWLSVVSLVLFFYCFVQIKKTAVQ